MGDKEREDRTTYKVVINHEEQYSIWPDGRENAPGWTDVGKSGSRDECLEHIEEVWTNMRPLSLRLKMEEMEEAGTQLPEPASNGVEIEGVGLVERLSVGDHPVEVSIRPDRDVSSFKECIDRNYVHIKFTDTRGGTELGVQLDREETNLNLANFEVPSGDVHLVGDLTLNYVQVRCVADIELKTLAGSGHLELVEV